MTVLADRYELGDLLGAGGMARVVAGHDTVLDRPVAVKLLRDVPDDGARERFLREARSSAKLRHPSAVAVYDTGEDAGQPYIVMELIEGRSLSDLLKERGQLDIEEAVAITASVLEALAAAHRSGLVHRDVKPGNVLLPDEGGVKLSDFGIAKALDDAGEGLTATGSVLGTPTFLAPELIEGVAASPASDLYSTGCLLYAQLAGRAPFTEGGPLAVAYAHRHDPVPPIEQLRPDVPEDLRRVLDRALAKDPAERYPDAQAMRAALLGGPEAAPTHTQVLPASAAASGPATAEVPTQAVGADERVAPDEPARRGRGRAVVVTLVVLALLGLGIWALVSALGGDEDPVEELEELEEPVDDEPDEPEPDDPEPDEPEPDEPDTPEPPPTDPGPDDPPVDDAPETPTPEEPAPDDDPAPEDEPEVEDDPAPEEDPEADDPADGAAPGPPDQVPGEGQPGGGSAAGPEDAPVTGSAADGGPVGDPAEVEPAQPEDGPPAAVPDAPSPPDPEATTRS